MEALIELLGIQPTPVTDRHDVFKLTCKCEFEPFGKASEDWEFIWILELPTIPFYWHSINGWKLGGLNSGMRFTGHTPEHCLQQAYPFAEWYALNVLHAV